MLPPIYVMRPLRGQLEQATRWVVDRLRSEGHSSVFWLDTSGWLNTEADFEGSEEDQSSGDLLREAIKSADIY